jgi:CHAT domain-containing protein
MTHFYRGLWERGLTPAAALAAAQRELSGSRRFRDPYYWAGFVLVGDWR